MAGRTAGFCPGQMVVAQAGREAGRLFVVVAMDDEFLYLADGEKRPLERPKKKNPRHVRRLDEPAAYLPVERFSNQAIREALRAVERGAEPWPNKT